MMKIHLLLNEKVQPMLPTPSNKEWVDGGLAVGGRCNIAEESGCDVCVPSLLLDKRDFSPTSVILMYF